MVGLDMVQHLKVVLCAHELTAKSAYQHSLKSLRSTGSKMESNILSTDAMPQWLRQGLSQDLETRCPKLAIVKSLGVQTFKGDHNRLGFQP